MSLTKSDLSAIGTLIRASENRLETKLVKRIDELAEDTAKGFEEVHLKFDRVDKRFDALEKRVSEVNRVDEQSAALKKMRKTLKAV